MRPVFKGQGKRGRRPSTASQCGKRTPSNRNRSRTPMGMQATKSHLNLVDTRIMPCWFPKLKPELASAPSGRLAVEILNLSFPWLHRHVTLFANLFLFRCLCRFMVISASLWRLSLIASSNHLLPSVTPYPHGKACLCGWVFSPHHWTDPGPGRNAPPVSHDYHQIGGGVGCWRLRGGKDTAAILGAKEKNIFKCQGMRRWIERLEERSKQGRCGCNIQPVLAKTGGRAVSAADGAAAVYYLHDDWVMGIGMRKVGPTAQ
jgi:hypothetical protein